MFERVSVKRSFYAFFSRYVQDWTLKRFKLLIINKRIVLISKSHQNTHNSAKYEVLWKCQITLPNMKYQLRSILDVSVFSIIFFFVSICMYLFFGVASSQNWFKSCVPWPWKSFFSFSQLILSFNKLVFRERSRKLSVITPRLECKKCNKQLNV